MNIVFGTDTTINGMPATSGFDLAQVAADYPTSVTGVSDVLEDDLTLTTATTEGTVRINDVYAELRSLDSYPVTLSSLTPSVCTVDSSGEVARVADGVCTVQGSSRYGNKNASFTISTQGVSELVTATAGFTPGSLRKYLVEQQLAGLTGVTAGSSAQRAFSSGSSGTVNTANFLRSPTAAQLSAGFDALPVDALDALIASDNSIGWKAWITPHHFLTWRGHGSSSSAGSWVSIGGEIVVEYSAVEWTGTLCQLLPANWRDYMPEHSHISGQINEEIHCWSRLHNTYGSETRWVMPTQVGYGCNPYPGDDTRNAYLKSSATHPHVVLSGDSGSPSFIGINGVLVPLGHTSGPGMVCGRFYGDNRSEIDAAVTALDASGSQAVLTIDLSGFTSYA